MPVDTKHPSYDWHATEWSEIRDSFAGEKAIKGKTREYLPVPSGYDDGVNDERYIAYLKRSRFPDLVAPALRASIGKIFRRPITSDLPEKLNYIKNSATPDGISLEEFIQKIAAETMLTGRVALMVDMPKSVGSESLPYLVSADAEQLINWRENVIDGNKKISLAVIYSVFSKPDANDMFQSINYEQWLVMSLDDQGKYLQSVFQKSEKEKEITEVETSQPSIMGERIDRIPLWVIGSTGVGLDFDIKPMLGVSRLAIAIYQQYADYRQALFISASPTPYLTGVNPEDQNRPRTVGGAVLWVIANADAKVGFLEFDGASMSEQRESIANDYSHALQLGASLEAGSRNTAESGEALRIRQGVQTATLQSIVSSIEDGINRALRFAAEWVNADPNEVKIQLNRDFVEDRLSGGDLTALVAAQEAGAFPKSVLWHNLRKTEIIPQQMTDDELQRLMEQEPPSFAADGTPFEDLVARLKARMTDQGES